MSSSNAPICMAEEYWRSSQLSVARFFGGINFNGFEYSIVNKAGITVIELSDPNNKHFVPGDMVIQPGEPCDLVRKDFIPFYAVLGRDAFLSVLKDNQHTDEKGLNTIFKEKEKEFKAAAKARKQKDKVTD